MNVLRINVQRYVRRRFIPSIHCVEQQGVCNGYVGPSMKNYIQEPSCIVRKLRVFQDGLQIRTISNHKQSYDRLDYDYYQQDNEPESDTWEPDSSFLTGIKRHWKGLEPTLNELIRDDVPIARQLFQQTLQLYYRKDIGMWNKWGVMEWKVGNFSLARMIFKKASKISYDMMLWQSWASMELDSGNISKAKQLYEFILATDPDNPKAGLGIAFIEVRRGNIEKARDIFQDLFQQHPEDIQIIQSMAVFEAKNNRLAIAREYFQYAENNIHIMTVHVWHAWAKAEYDAGNYNHALNVVHRGLIRHPVNKRLVLVQAMTYFQLGNVLEARRAYNRLIHGGLYVEAAAYNSMAQMEKDLGDLENAIKLYESALSNHIDHVPSIMALAEAYYEKNSVSKKIDTSNKDAVLFESRELFERAIQENSNHEPTRLKVMYAWGNFEEKYGDLKLAEELFSTITTDNRSDLDAWKSLARILVKLDNPDEARAVLKMASKHCDNDVSLLISIAKAEKQFYNIKGARAALDQAIHLSDQMNGAAWNMRAIIELKSNPERSKQMISTALKKIPEFETASHAILWSTRGRASMQLNDVDDAIASFGMSFKLAPKNWETHWLYVESVLLPSEEYEQALRHLKLALQFAPKGTRKLIKIHESLKNVQRILQETTIEHDIQQNDEEEG